MEGTNIIGVQFRRAGRIYDFSGDGLDLKIGDDVVVDTERGPSLAKIAIVRFDEAGAGRDKELKPILRVATRRDLEETRKLTPEVATSYARERVERLALKMSVLQSEVQFGGNKVIVYFAAPGRVDFRELVKELATGLKARVELKQVGARDEAKLVGGIGICGREFCCSSFLREFVPVSIKMAKNQNLALNPSKVSGGCGRLLCCLTYENDLYTDLRRKLPPKGARVRAIEEDLVGDVIKGDVLNQVVLIEVGDGRLVQVPVAKLEIVERGAGRTPDEDGIESEAEVWGEDIDLAALSDLEDESARGQKGPGKAGGPRGGGGGGAKAEARDRPRNERGARAPQENAPHPGKGQGGGEGRPRQEDQKGRGGRDGQRGGRDQNRRDARGPGPSDQERGREPSAGGGSPEQAPARGPRNQEQNREPRGQQSRDQRGPRGRDGRGQQQARDNRGDQGRGDQGSDSHEAPSVPRSDKDDPGQGES